MTLSNEAIAYIAQARKQNMKELFTNKDIFAKVVEDCRGLQAKPYKAPDYLYDLVDVEVSTSASGFDSYTLMPKAREGFPGRHIIYYHGGAFFMQIEKLHWDYVVRLALQSNAAVTVPIYPLAPTHDFKVVYAYLLEVYRWVLERTPANKVVLMGDSAGGMFDIVTAQLASLEGLEQPALIMPFSPVLELRPPDPDSIDLELDERDIMLSNFASDGLNDVFIGDPAYLDAFPANPMLGPVDNLAPIVLYAGGDEIFSVPAIEFGEKVAAAGGAIEIHIVPGMWHIFPLNQGIPESEEATAEVIARLKAI
nr:esterase/lipase 11 [uncultured bacterium]